MKKSSLILLVLIPFVIFCLNLSKKERVYYIPFDIPGPQMAITIPPFGIFIEKKLKNNKSVLRHEEVHWNHQYCKMGLFGFYSQYFSEYSKYGRKYGPMEVEARKLSK